jgi:hypothetical protein
MENKRRKRTHKFNQKYKKLVEELILVLENDPDTFEKLYNPFNTVKDLKTLLKLPTTETNIYVQCFCVVNGIHYEGLFKISTFVALVAKNSYWTFDNDIVNSKDLNFLFVTDENVDYTSVNLDENEAYNFDQELEYIIQLALEWHGNVQNKRMLIDSLIKFAKDFPIEQYLYTDISDPKSWIFEYCKNYY